MPGRAPITITPITATALRSKAFKVELSLKRQDWDFLNASLKSKLCIVNSSWWDSHEGDSLVRPGYGDLMPKKEVIQVNLAAANPNLSPATRFGDLVFVAGQTGRHPITGEVGRDVREQTRYAIERIKMILETAGTSLDNVLTVLTHLTRREDLAAYNEEYAKFFPSNKPARTTVEVMLNAPELLVEITVTACIPD